jgi:hypothetical protein
MSKKKCILAALFSLLAALLLGGCGSGNREGASQGGSPLFGGVATVGDSVCIQCHSSVTEALTGETLVTQYQLNSPHNVDGLGCESCHGGGAGHNGVGPIPFPQPDANRCATCHNGVQTLLVNGVATVAPATNANTDFATSNHVTGTPAHTSGHCVRCHTHEGAVLSDISGFTGELASGTVAGTSYPGVLDNPAYGPPVWANGYTSFKCETCHQHGGGLRNVKARDNAPSPDANIVLWNPDKSGTTDQFNLCTSCHNLYNYNGTRVIASNSAASGTLKYEHNTRWNRILVSTHKEKGMASLLTLPFANMTSAADASNTWITGYAIRLTNNNKDASYKGPCFDCHGHEAKTNTGSSAPSSATSTIHTDWAQSAHAGGLLTAKYAAAVGNLRTAAEVDAVIQAYVDSSTSVWSDDNWDDTSTSGTCQMCHTATGISNYMVNQNTDRTGYSPANNNFSHLIGWNATGGSKRQNELLYCWGCHKDAGTGALRNTTQAILSFTDSNNQSIVITGAGKSTVCVVCHGGRGSAGIAAASDTTRSSRFNGHHAATAGVLYSAQTHIGYEYSGLSYANPSFFAHDKIGLNGDGPCASCHMGPAASDGKPSHTFSPVTTDITGTITAINNQTLCNTCHTGAYAMTPAVLEEESAGYAEASTILNNWVLNLPGYANYLGYAINSTNYKNQILAQPVSSNDYGAFQNAKIGTDEPCGYVHNRFYVKRLIFDSIDWLDNGVLNGTISIDATTYPNAALWFGAPAGTTGTFTATRP